MRLDLNGLADASREALMSEWREVVGRPPPKHLSKPLMVQILSYAYQLETVCGYTKRLDRSLKSAARRDVVRPAFKPGSRFVSEYHGITHVVEVCDDGRFMWQEQSFKSLSHTARAITGYNVSGFQFFGVKLWAFLESLWCAQRSGALFLAKNFSNHAWITVCLLSSRL